MKNDNKIIAFETLLIALVGVSDLWFSEHFVHVNVRANIYEGNPLMAPLFCNMLLLIITKLFLLFVPLTILEFCRRHRPKFTAIMSWGCLSIYVLSLLQLLVCMIAE